MRTRVVVLLMILILVYVVNLFWELEIGSPFLRGLMDVDNKLVTNNDSDFNSIFVCFCVSMKRNFLRDWAI